MHEYDRYKCLHVGHSYPRANYSFEGVEIKNARAEKDLSVTAGCTLDSSHQCAKAASATYKVFNVINRTYVHKTQ